MSRTIYNLDNVEDLSRIFDALTDGIYITNANGLTLKVNKAYEDITGIKKEQVVGKYMKDIVKEGILSKSVTQTVIDTKKEVIMEQEINNGKKVVLRGVPLFEEGEIKIVVSFVRDNTVILKVQEELDRSKLMIDQYKKKLREFSQQKKFVADSKEFKSVINIARKVANVDSTVLILGESGTGKEVIAREIHEKSHRSKNLFLKVNCGAIPENLLESELFGYESGAFTGAKKNGHIGIFEMATKGIVFLDEIGDMPLSLQVKLLRVLQEKTITRIGSSTPIEIDTRVIAATNLDLEEMVREKKFRKDLYYRLNVVVIKSSPLRERKTDIPGLIDFFVSKINDKYNLNKKFTPSLIKSFMEYNWPGNVRELENIIERIIVTTDEEEISFQAGMFTWEKENVTNEVVLPDEIMPLKEAFELVERRIILNAAKKYKTTYEIAKVLEISQPSVSRKLSKYRNS